MPESVGLKHAGQGGMNVPKASCQAEITGVDYNPFHAARRDVYFAMVMAGVGVLEMSVTVI